MDLYIIVLTFKEDKKREMYGVSFIICFISFAALTNQVWPMANSIGQDCMVSLTIPMDSIKSSCNTDERTLRKMKALEAKLERMYTVVRGLEVRMPQVTSQLGGNQETMRRLEFNLAQSATYVKKLEDKILELESKLPVNGEDNIVSQRSNSLDSLLDPVRPLVMNELERFKDIWMRDLAENIVPAILNSENKLGLAFKEKFIQNLRAHIQADLFKPSEIVESSSEIEDDINNSTDLEELGTEFTVVTKPTEIPQTTSETPWDPNSLDMLARTLKSISIGPDNNTKGNANTEDKTSNSSSVFNRENVLKLLTFVKSQISKEMNEKINEFGFKIQNISDVLFTRCENLENNISKYHGNKEAQRNIIENNLSNISKALSLLEAKFNETVRDLPKTIENYTKLKMSTLETSISQKLHEAVSRLDEEIYSQGRRVNLSTSLVNIFQGSLAKYHNQSKTDIIQLQQKVGELSLLLKANANDDNDAINERVKSLETEIRAVVDSYIFMKESNDNFKVGLTENHRNAKNEIQNLNRQLQALEYEVFGIDQLKVAMGNQDMVLNNTVDKVNIFEIKLSDIQKTFTDFTIEVMSKIQWVPYNFSNSLFRNGCEGGKKYIRKSFFESSVIKFVGVQLCSITSRYKIFLAASKEGMFYDIGDKTGRGEDHCQFVGATVPDNTTKAYTVDKTFVFSSTEGKQILLNLLLNIYNK